MDAVGYVFIGGEPIEQRHAIVGIVEGTHGHAAIPKALYVGTAQPAPAPAAPPRPPPKAAPNKPSFFK